MIQKFINLKGLLQARSRGFTLIELLVVIAIIGILATVVILSLQSTRGRARDGKRASDLTSLRTAIEGWQTQWATTPPALSGSAGDISSLTGGGVETAFDTADAGDGTGVAPDFLKQYPVDPRPGNAPYRYWGDGTGSYKIFACFENNVPSTNPNYGGSDPNNSYGASCPTAQVYRVQN